MRPAAPFRIIFCPELNLWLLIPLDEMIRGPLAYSAKRERGGELSAAFHSWEGAMRGLARELKARAEGWSGL